MICKEYIRRYMKATTTLYAGYFDGKIYIFVDQQCPNGEKSIPNEYSYYWSAMLKNKITLKHIGMHATSVQWSKSVKLFKKSQKILPSGWFLWKIAWLCIQFSE